MIKLNNDFIKCQYEYFELGEKTEIYQYENIDIKYANTTSGKILPLKNTYVVNLKSRLTNEKITIEFLCNAKYKSHNYFKIIGVEKNGRYYRATRYFIKYLCLVGELVNALSIQEKEIC